jgi:hypothetical protein
MDLFIEEIKTDIRASQEERKANQDRLEGKIKASDEKFEVLQEEMKTQIGCLASKMDTHHERTMGSQEELMAMMKATEACLEKAEANPEEKEAIAEQQEVPNEEAAVEIIGALEDRCRDRCVAVRRQEQPKKWTQGDGGSWWKCAAVHRQVAHHAIPSPHKGHCHQGPDGDSVARGAPKGSGRDVRHSINATAASEAKQKTSYIWEARRHFMSP